MKRTTLAMILLSALLISAVAGTLLVKPGKADPIPAPLVSVNSPQNNKVYYSTNVQLTFIPFPNNGWNFTSFAYSLDGKPEVPTNESTTLTDLSYGSHTITIYASGTYEGGGQYDMMANEVYFSVEFSTAWLTFSMVLVVIACIGIMLGLLLRKQLIRTLRGKKTASFWFGLVWFLFFAILAALVYLPLINNYLSPSYPSELSLGYWPFTVLVFGSFFIVLSIIGLYWMISGIKKNQSPQPSTS